MSEFPETIAKIVGRPVDAACNLIESLLGEPFKVAGDILSDQVKTWQWKNRIRIAERAQTIMLQRKISQRILPPDFLLPLIRECGDTSDETLQEAWARLLCEAMADDTAQQIGFVHTLKELSPNDAKVLNSLVETGPLSVKRRPLELAKRTGLPIRVVYFSLNNIHRLGLFSATGRRLSGFGIDFLRVCLADKTKLDNYIELQKKLNSLAVRD